MCTREKFVALVGVDDLVIVETDDALLVTTREQAQDVGKVVKYLDDQKFKRLVYGGQGPANSLSRKIAWQNRSSSALTAGAVLLPTISPSTTCAAWVTRSRPTFTNRRTRSKGLVVGYDTRFLSQRFAETISEVLAGAGIAVRLSDDYTPTPALSYAVKNLGAQAE